MASAESTSPSALQEQRRSEQWLQKVAELSGRGISLADILDFYIGLFRTMPHFNPAKSTTRDVVRGAVIPQTARLGYGKRRHHMKAAAGDVPADCAYATRVNRGVRNEPERFVTHTWGSRFCHTIAAIVADAQGAENFSEVAARLSSAQGARQVKEGCSARSQSVVYWVCAFSVNHHASICGSFVDQPEKDTVKKRVYPLCECMTRKYIHGDQCETNKLHDLMTALKRHCSKLHHVVAVDVDFTVFKRTWCNVEIMLASQLELTQSFKICDRHCVELHRPELGALDICRCRASRSAEKEELLSKIEDTADFNTKLRAVVLGSSDLYCSDLSRELVTLARRGAPARRTKGEGKAGLSRPASTGALQRNSSSTGSLAERRPRSAGGARRREANSSTREPGLKAFKALLQKVLALGGNLDWSEKPYCRSALWWAASRARVGYVALLLEHHASVSKFDTEERTPLHEAAYYGHWGVVDVLLSKGHPVNCVDKHGQTPLFRAVENRRLDVVSLLVERRADANILDPDNVTVQHLAAFKGMSVTSQWLLHHGAFKNRFDLEETARAEVIQASMLRAASQASLGASELSTVASTSKLSRNSSSPNLAAGGAQKNNRKMGSVVAKLRLVTLKPKASASLAGRSRSEERWKTPEIGRAHV
eukprot:TRINITY_DN94261_c0_g1_i1.p1 TRINITY_DN94261_c0_g1~~TRINITY_DN94261_c0_g1_i1.p1  ORF type:complete len:662 (+),score=129.04 TRINITY_DN94261_c0_g1_i1:35-1987(+)